MDQPIKNLTNLYPQILVAPSKEWELKIEFNKGDIGHGFTYSWRRVEEEKWYKHEDIFFCYNLIDGDDYGYEKIKWIEDKNKNILVLTPYSNWKDITPDSDEFDVVTNSFLKSK